MTARFGKIDFKLACRFNELTRNEIRVLVYLYICRNEKTGQCNPSRKTIIKDTKLEKGNLSKAISGLEDKGFIIEFQDSSFELISAENIVNPNLEVVETPTVVKSPTKVVETPTKSCRTANPHIKEAKQRKNRERTEKKNADKSARLRNPVDLRPPEFKTFRESLFDIHSDRLDGAVSDAAAQNKAIGWLFDKNFSSDDCLKLYAEQLKELKPSGWRSAVSWLTVKKEIADWIFQGKPILGSKNEKSYRHNNNGNQRRSDADIFAESADFYAKW